MRGHRFLVAAFTVAAVAGCATVQVGPQVASTTKAGRSVELNADLEAAVGATMLSEFSYLAQKSVVTTASYERTVGLSKVSIPAGSALVAAEVDGHEAYCTKGPAMFSFGSPGYPVCLFDTKNSGTFDQFKMVGTMAFQMHDANIPYSVGEVAIGSDGFKYELLYEGVDHDALRLSYREYKDNMARPAFQQDLVYTLNRPGPTAISFKGVRMSISSADNNAVRYRVLSGFRR